MRRILKKTILILLCLSISTALFSEPQSTGLTNSNGQNDDLKNYRLYSNDETGYDALINDDAKLLSDWEKDELIKDMAPITQWGNVYFQTVDDYFNMSPEELSANLYEYMFGYNASGVIFLIDMYQRWIYIYSDGEMYKAIDSDYAQFITDNIYKMATNAEYYSCALSAFTMIQMKLTGK